MGLEIDQWVCFTLHLLFSIFDIRKSPRGDTHHFHVTVVKQDHRNDLSTFSHLVVAKWVIRTLFSCSKVRFMEQSQQWHLGAGEELVRSTDFCPSHPYLVKQNLHCNKMSTWFQMCIKVWETGFLFVFTLGFKEEKRKKDLKRFAVHRNKGDLYLESVWCFKILW